MLSTARFFDASTPHSKQHEPPAPRVRQNRAGKKIERLGDPYRIVVESCTRARATFLDLSIFKGFRWAETCYPDRCTSMHIDAHPSPVVPRSARQLLGRCSWIKTPFHPLLVCMRTFCRNVSTYLNNDSLSDDQKVSLNINIAWRLCNRHLVQSF